MSARYITTTIPYVNASPHIGFALEIVQADVLARVWRVAGDEVFFSTGSDEHGQKIAEAAEKAGQKTQDYVDRYAAEVEKLKELLNLSNDTFVRTTSPEHIKAAQEMWKRCEASGDIYKKSYTGLYCIGCELFKTEKEIFDGHCELHPNLELQEVTEENYFFKFSKYQDWLQSDYLKRPGVIVPEWRLEEARAFVAGGLEDFSISREKKRLTWGIPVPGDDTQVMYVWFDALVNYISTLGWPDSGGNFNKFWQEGETLQVAGKDQIRFQSLMWQAMLKSAGVKPTDHVFYHGFITSGGQKMSKSLGNVINPLDLVEKYGTDAVRYILLRHVSPTGDSDLTLEAIHDHYTANLTNGIGNLVARVMQMATTYFHSPVEMTQQTVSDPTVQASIQAFEFNEAMNGIWERIGHNDALITLEKPFTGIKSDDKSIHNKAQEVIEKLVRELHAIAIDLAPFMPTTSEKILAAVRENKKPENLFPRI